MKVTGKAAQVKAGADALTQLKERFAAWRAVRKLGMRIPSELWSAAVEMVAVHGACQVAGELNLDYDMLQAAGRDGWRHGDEHRTGTPVCRAVRRSWCDAGAERYLGAFAYRFNRRFDLAGLVVRLVVDVSRSTAAPERVIRHA